MSDDCSCGHPQEFHALGCLGRKCSCAIYMTTETRTALRKLLLLADWMDADE